nr:hypothetical protein [uncultured Acetobacter sp.]
MKRSLDDLSALVALMRKYHVETLEEKTGQNRIFLRLLPENTHDTLSPSPRSNTRHAPLLSPEMGLLRQCPNRTDGALIARGDIVAFVAVDLLLLPVIASETGILHMVPRPSNTVVGYHEVLGQIIVSDEHTLQ